MSQDKDKIEWSDTHWKELLIEQRKFMWHQDTIDKLAIWIGLKHGIIAVDIGCGIGFLGHTFWPYFGQDGRYIGVDASTELLLDSSRAAQVWSENGETSFVAGDVYKLPFRSEFADLVICQTLMMHLDKPFDALTEMARIAKPGGLIVCIEPDNLSSALVKYYSSLPELDLENELLSRKITILVHRGRIKLGRGDDSIGTQIPHLMNTLGLIEIDIRINDRVWFIEPPYREEIHKHRLEMARKNLLDEKTYSFWQKRQKEEFLAGGGDSADYDRHLKIMENLRPLIQQQFDKKEFFCCSSHDFYVIKGKKPVG